MHFRDQNNFSTLSESLFFSNLRHCDEILHQIDLILHTLKARGEQIQSCEDYSAFLAQLDKIVKRSGLSQKNFIEHVGERVRNLEKQLQSQTKYLDELDSQIMHKEETRAVLEVFSRNG